MNQVSKLIMCIWHLSVTVVCEQTTSIRQQHIQSSLYLSNTSTLTPATSRSKDQASNSRSPHSIPPNISRVDYLGHSSDHYSDEYSNYNTGTIYEGYGNSPGGRVTFRILDEASSSSAMYPDTLQGLDFMYFHDRRQRGFQGSNNYITSRNLYLRRSTVLIAFDSECRK